MKVLKYGFLFSYRILNFSIMIQMCSKLSLLPSNHISAVDTSAVDISAVDISAVDISAADISVADISIVEISVYW